ncbi:SDR family NAD(P)-dependent oxidoreductase [Mucilaginibacter sp. X5P1]|uniref:SDR family NAD(P)-dependent oxidoreductase n=1 Tax=Mucilaginibacter sp. X5P1 TaxID=2723088 RepID=UPI003B003B5E
MTNLQAHLPYKINPKMRLKNKIAVISGGTSGIGLAIAKRFVEEGAEIFIFGRRKDALDEAVRVIGGKVTAIQADASKLKDLDHVTDVVRKAKGKVDILVSNAGFTEQVPLREITEDHYDRTFDLMAKGPLFLTQKMLPLMDSGGSIILVSSAMHYMGLANHSAYAGAKAALRSFVRTWAAEFKGNGIRANLLSPGPFPTAIMEAQANTSEELDALQKYYANFVPMLRLGRVEEAAAAAVFLASDESSFMTGSDVVVDGGISSI